MVCSISGRPRKGSRLLSVSIGQKRFPTPPAKTIATGLFIWPSFSFSMPFEPLHDRTKDILSFRSTCSFHDPCRTRQPHHSFLQALLSHSQSPFDDPESYRPGFLRSLRDLFVR